MILPMRFSALHNEPQNALRAVDAPVWSGRAMPHEDFTTQYQSQGEQASGLICGALSSGVA